MARLFVTPSVILREPFATLEGKLCDRRISYRLGKLREESRPSANASGDNWKVKDARLFTNVVRGFSLATEKRP